MRWSLQTLILVLMLFVALHQPAPGGVHLTTAEAAATASVATNAGQQSREVADVGSQCQIACHEHCVWLASWQQAAIVPAGAQPQTTSTPRLIAHRQRTLLRPPRTSSATA